MFNGLLKTPAVSGTTNYTQLCVSARESRSSWIEDNTISRIVITSVGERSSNVKRKHCKMVIADLLKE